MWYGEGNMALFYVLLRGWMYLGYSEFVLRCLPVFFGAATIPAVYQLGNRFLSRNAGLAGAALLAAHSFHLRSSQFLRSYSLLLFLLVLSTHFFLAAVESPHQKGIWAAYVLTSGLAIYAHMFAVLVLVPQWLSLAPSGLRRIGLVRLFWIVAAVGALVWPMAAEILQQKGGQLDWIPPPTIGRFLQVMQMLAGSYPWPPRPTAEGYVLLVPYAGFWILAVLGMIYSAAPESRASTGNPAVRLLTLWFVFPIAATVAFSLVKPLSHPKYLFHPQFMSLCVPAAVLLAGQGISILSGLAPRRRWIFSVALFFMLALSIEGIAGYYAGVSLRSHHYDLRPVTRYILARQSPGDAVFFYIRWRQPYPYLYYVRRELSSQSIADAPVAFCGNLSPEKVDLVTRVYKRIWLVLEIEDSELMKQAPLIRSTLEAHFHFVGEQDFPGEGIPSIRVALFAKGPEPREKSPY